MMESVIMLANTLASKPRLNDDELGCYRTLVTFIDLQFRLMLIAAEKEAKLEGLTDEELRRVA